MKSKIFGAIDAFKLVDEKGIPYGVKQSDGKIRVSSMSYSYDIAEGNFPNHWAKTLDGFNTAVGITFVELWDDGAAYVYPTVAVINYISSSNDTDTQVYEVSGLDADYVEQTINVTAVGQTKTQIGTGETFIRIFEVKNLGTTDNAGTVYVYEDSATTDGVPDVAASIKNVITIGFNKSLSAIWTVPAERTSYIVSLRLSTSSAKQTEFGLFVRPFGGVFQIHKLLTIVTGFETFNFHFPIQVTEKSDICLKAKISSTPVAAAAGSFGLWYEI